ncbi:fatty acid-binding protein, liver-type-like [Eucyclogobius newberryi]|uniref:fatty acid-binding protein, liver-type-like n=1 Tax=Eucyclogobius newberryi TaxID=166745 RepID=UPI003B58CBEA
MSFTGTFKEVSQENSEAFMRAFGTPEEHIKIAKDLKSITEIEENGDHFKMTITTGTHVSVVSFTVGQECEIDSITGEKFKGVIKREGNKLIGNMKGIESVTELVDANTIVNTSTLGGIKFKKTSKRV